MSKPPLLFTCTKCDAQFSKWNGRCLECGQWGTVKKTEISGAKFDPKSSADTGDKTAKYKSKAPTYAPLQTVSLNEITDQDTPRAKTKIDELDRVLGGGLVPGSLILLGGEPGIGKSTLALQIANLIPDSLYISGEESNRQIKLRADRLKIKSNSLRMANALNVENIISTLQKYPDTPLMIIDSIQTIKSDEAEGEAGSIGQIRACTAKLMTTAKSGQTAIIIIGQVTKDGAMAGPKALEHIVDTVLYLEGDRFHQFRILRAVKNRFGSTDESGIFTMEENGLQAVANPSLAFLAGREATASGSAITCLIEGTRPILLEIQALISKTNFGYAQRRASRFELNRLQMLIAVLSKRTGLNLDNHDIFLNVVGGINANEPAADMAVILAIASAARDKALPPNLAVFGEIGLNGEVRAVAQTKKRLQEAKKLGFEYVAIPAMSINDKITGLKIAPVKNVRELVEKMMH
ncbi:MAG: DNA repair protein RadA [Candidatus Magasanikbacteria bacterium CG10_big_fil_rev_8_21_14_0_10_40_10]|uniref:DNA repair protein RadA n=1 Tax=Candidatus Magasanikbacteria bacterium CG10_big_fil_rev_8_21_14_0_10_40_10 TaxID=1974648 RepID=A0A2M6W4B2_9BACT|nr:MAG: DNA repair protein RadA [Candidatus Magasanikbacteria bacterium CG10_big_fil_rev_8_21_14_0_10_40_10]